MHLSVPPPVRKIMRHESVLEASRPPNGERRVEPGHAAAMALYAGRAKVVIMSVLPPCTASRYVDTPSQDIFLTLPSQPVQCCNDRSRLRIPRSLAAKTALPARPPPLHHSADHRGSHARCGAAGQQSRTRAARLGLGGDGPRICGPIHAS